MGRVRIKAIGQFGWHFADIGVECLDHRCGLMTVYSDWEAETCFRERKWPVDLERAVRQFRCRCGSRNIRLVPIPIYKRPKPIPTRPAALRPIYREDARALLRRGRHAWPEGAGIEEALEVLRRAAAVDATPADRGAQAKAAIEVVRPYVYQQAVLDRLWEAMHRTGDQPWGRGLAYRQFVGVLSQLGIKE